MPSLKNIFGGSLFYVYLPCYELRRKCTLHFMWSRVFVFRTIRTKFGQHSDKIRTKFGQNSDNIRPKFGQNSDNIRTQFGQNSTNSDKIWKKLGQISDKIRQNSDKCPLLRWWRHICRTIVPTLKSILQIV